MSQLRRRTQEREPTQQKLVDVITEADGRVGSSTVKEEYHDRLDEDVTDQQCRRNLGKLENYGFTESNGSTKDAEYRYFELE